VLAGMRLEVACTFADEERLQAIENDRDQNSMPARWLHNIVVLGVFVHTDLVGGEVHHEDRYGSVRDRASCLGEPAVADFEVVVATALDLDLAVLGLDDTHLVCLLHLTCSQVVVKDIPRLAAVEEEIAAFHLACLTLESSLCVYEADS
jgi:hypothetical protein